MRISGSEQEATMTYSTAAQLCLTVLVLAGPVSAAELTVTLNKATQEGVGEAAGTIIIADSPGGATFKLNLHGLPPGPHGFHAHENGSCGITMMNNVRIPGGAAGGHLDPQHTARHEGPAGAGHLGDLPLLDVAANGTATQTLSAPRIKDAGSLHKHSLIIHANGDNYSDSPAALGGAGGRIACGVIE
jgi:superoxide dismutase, Cu-Zn family